VFPRDIVCLRNISTLHKGDDDDDDNNNNNNNNNSTIKKRFYYYYYYYKLYSFLFLSLLFPLTLYVIFVDTTYSVLTLLVQLEL